jgi:hypothetical protein
VLQLTAGVQVHVYMDSKYAFTMIQVNEARCKERGLINLGGISVKCRQEILELLEAVGPLSE